MKRSVWFLSAATAVLTMSSMASAGVVFTDGYEEGTGNWTPWTDLYWEPGVGGCWQLNNCWGPHAIFLSENHPHSGVKCGRQEQAMPWWYGSKSKDGILPPLPTDKTIRLCVFQFEDANPIYLEPATNPPKPGDARAYQNHDQVQGWVALMGDGFVDGATDETEFLAIGVHAHWAIQDANVTDWYQNLACATAAGWTETLGGWALTSPRVPRVQGMRRLEIWVHPYTGANDDVEFFVNGVRVGSGSRKTDDFGSVIPISRIALGSNPVHMVEDYISNSYEFFWYDDVKLTTGVLADCDDDGDVDLVDFGIFQNCFNGPNRPAKDPGNCMIVDFDADGDVDLVDFGVFQRCFNGPNRTPPYECR